MNKRLVTIVALILVVLIIIITSILLGNKGKQDAYNEIYINEVENDSEQNSNQVIEQEQPPIEEVQPEVVEEPIVETPVEDVYELASVPVIFDEASIDPAQLTPVTDPVVIASIEEYIKHFHYNYFFHNGINSENGNVEIDAMTLFALSYIMQNEHNELRFDSTNFRLYIPKNHVIEVVQKFFYRQLDMFKAYPDLKIDYADEVYSVVVPDEEWNDDIKAESIEKLGDFTYKVTCTVTDRTTLKVIKKIHSIIDESKDGPVLVNYKVEEITQ